MRAHLREHGYRIAEVPIDFGDAPATPPYHIQSDTLLRHVCAHAPPP